jgi:hypothetical protein
MNEKFLLSEPICPVSGSADPTKSFQLMLLAFLLPLRTSALRYAPPAYDEAEDQTERWWHRRPTQSPSARSPNPFPEEPLRDNDDSSTPKFERPPPKLSRAPVSDHDEEPGRRDGDDADSDLGRRFAHIWEAPGDEDDDEELNMDDGGWRIPIDNPLMRPDNGKSADSGRPELDRRPTQIHRPDGAAARESADSMAHQFGRRPSHIRTPSIPNADDAPEESVSLLPPDLDPQRNRANDADLPESRGSDWPEFETQPVYDNEIHSRPTDSARRDMGRETAPRDGSTHIDAGPGRFDRSASRSPQKTGSPTHSPFPLHPSRDDDISQRESDTADEPAEFREEAGHHSGTDSENISGRYVADQRITQTQEPTDRSRPTQSRFDGLPQTLNDSVGSSKAHSQVDQQPTMSAALGAPSQRGAAQADGRKQPVGVGALPTATMPRGLEGREVTALVLVFVGASVVLALAAVAQLATLWKTFADQQTVSPLLRQSAFYRCGFLPRSPSLFPCKPLSYSVDAAESGSGIEKVHLNSHKN